MTITASGPRRSARRCAPTTLAPVEIPAKIPSSRASRLGHLDRPRRPRSPSRWSTFSGIPVRHHGSGPALDQKRAPAVVACSVPLSVGTKAERVGHQLDLLLREQAGQSREAIGFVNAPSRGSRRRARCGSDPPLTECQSARKANSSGRDGALHQACRPGSRRGGHRRTSRALARAARRLPVCRTCTRARSSRPPVMPSVSSGCTRTPVRPRARRTGGRFCRRGRPRRARSDPSTSSRWKITPRWSWRRRGRRSRRGGRGRRARRGGPAGRRAGRRGRRRDLGLVRSNRRRSRFAVIVPPVPPPRITICFLLTMLPPATRPRPTLIAGLDRLGELDARLDRAPKRDRNARPSRGAASCASSRSPPSRIAIRTCAASSGGRIDRDGDSPSPSLRPRVHHERRRDAGGERGGE